MVTTWGASADQLEAVAAALGRAADLIDHNRVSLNSQVHHAPWRGPEADQFRRDWDQLHVRRLTSAAAFLHEARTRLLQNAADQRQASRVENPAPRTTVASSIRRSLVQVDLEARHDLANLGAEFSFFAYVGGSLFDLWNNSKSVVDEGKTLLEAAAGKDIFGDGFGALDLLATIPDVLQADKYLAARNLPDTFWAFGHVGIDVASSFNPYVAAASFGFYTAAPLIDHEFHISDHASSFVVDHATRDLYGVDPNHLSVQQAEQYAHRYDGASGVSNMIQDTFFAPAENVAKGFLAKVHL